MNEAKNAILNLTLYSAANLLRTRALSSRELTQAYLDSIEERDGEIGA